MSNSNEGTKCEAVKQTKIDELTEIITYTTEDFKNLRSRVYQACERIGVQFGSKDTSTPEAPPAHGSIPQLGESIRELGRLIMDTSTAMDELENYI